MQLNYPEGKYKEFYGRNTEEMPLLIAEGRVPISIAQLMQRRLEVRNSSQDVKTAWMDNYFDTGDAISYHSDGRIKIVPDSQHLRELTLESQLRSGTLVLTEDVYNALEGEEFKKDKYGKVNRRLSKKEAKAHPIWRALARDQNLLNDYVDFIFTEARERFGYDENMGVYIDYISDYIKLNGWCVSRLDFRVVAFGGDAFSNTGGRLVGLAPEA